jgi:hypothetical protein
VDLEPPWWTWSRPADLEPPGGPGAALVDLEPPWWTWSRPGGPGAALVDLEPPWWTWSRPGGPGAALVDLEPPWCGLHGHPSYLIMTMKAFTFCYAKAHPITQSAGRLGSGPSGGGDSR